LIGSRAEIDAQAEDAVFEMGLGVADHGVVHEVGPGLVHEALSLRSFEGRDAALAHGPSPGLEPLDHGVGIEVFGHRTRGYRRATVAGSDTLRPVTHVSDTGSTT
jgi:hypothetical protein